MAKLIETRKFTSIQTLHTHTLQNTQPLFSAEIPPIAQDIIALLADVDPCDKPQATDSEDPRGKLIF